MFTGFRVKIPEICVNQALNRPLKGNLGRFFRNFRIQFFLFFGSGTPIWLFLSSDSDSARQNPPWGHLQRSGNKYAKNLVLVRFFRRLEIFEFHFFWSIPGNQGAGTGSEAGGTLELSCVQRWPKTADGVSSYDQKIENN